MTKKIYTVITFAPVLSGYILNQEVNLGKSGMITSSLKWDFL
ncbi:hypothetical protein NUACC26_079210 [Scytonema sp. NUACC26]